MRALFRGDRERGASAIEVVLVTPVVFLVIFLTVQVALTWHASQVASATAREAARIARVGGGTPAANAAAEARGYDYARQVGRSALQDVQVEVAAVDGGDVRATVTGRGMEVVPGFRLRVDQTVQGPIEEFRPDF